MPRASNLVDYFPQLETISIDQVIHFFKKGTDLIQAENKLGNFLLYPNAIPQTEADLKFELALIQAVIAQDLEKYLNIETKRITIPHFFQEFFPNTNQLVQAFINALQPAGDVTVMFYTPGQKSEVLGTVNKWTKS